MMSLGTAGIALKHSQCGQAGLTCCSGSALRYAASTAEGVFAAECRTSCELAGNGVGTAGAASAGGGGGARADARGL